MYKRQVYYDANANPNTLPETAELTFNANPKDLLGGAKITAIFSEESKRTDVGNTANVIESYTFDSGNDSNYSVIPVAGELTITQADYKIKLEAGSATFTYDGQPHSVGLASATLNYGGKTIKVTPDSEEGNGHIVNSDDGTSTVTFVVGEETVFTLTTSEIYAKETDVWYDKNGDVSSYPVGSEDDLKIQVSLNNVDVTKNFVLDTFTPGKLTINPRPVAITANDNPNEVYDGEAYDPNKDMEDPIDVKGLLENHKVERATVEVWTKPETEDGQSVKLEDGAINAGTYTLRINNEDGENGVKITDGTNDVTTNYDIRLDDGTLTINPRPVTITASSNSKVYDGKAYDPNPDPTTGGFEPYTVSEFNEQEKTGLVEGHTVNAYIEVFPVSETEGEQGETTEAINAGTYTPVSYTHLLGGVRASGARRASLPRRREPGRRKPHPARITGAL